MKKKEWKKRALDAEWQVEYLEERLEEWKSIWQEEFSEVARLKFKYEPEDFQPW